MEIIIKEQLKDIFEAFPIYSQKYIAEKSFIYVVKSISERLHSFANIQYKYKIGDLYFRDGYPYHIRDEPLIYGIKSTLFEETIYKCMDGIIYSIMNYIKENNIASQNVCVLFWFYREEFHINFEPIFYLDQKRTGFDIDINEVYVKIRKELKTFNSIHVAEDLYHELIRYYIAKKLNLNISLDYWNRPIAEANLPLLETIHAMYKNPQEQYEKLDVIFTRVFDKCLDNLVNTLKNDYSEYLANKNFNINIIDYGIQEKDYHLIISYEITHKK